MAACPLTNCFGNPRRLHDGDSVFFSELVRREGSRLEWLAAQYASDPDEAAELVQVAWACAFLRRHQFRGRAGVHTWLFALTRNLCRSHARTEQRRRRRLALVDGSQILSDGWPDPDRDVGVPQEAVGRAFRTLGPRHQTAVWLRIVEGRSTREVAEHLHCAEGTVKSLVHRGLKRLRRELG